MTKNVSAGLEAGVEEVVVDTTKAEKKFQTPEAKAILEDAVNNIKAIGCSDKLAKILDLVPVWKGEDLEALAATKESVSASFGTKDDFKDYFDEQFDADMSALESIAKAVPVLNNICSFYARRAKTAGTSGSKKTSQVSIAGKSYTVNSAYYASIAAFEREEKIELILKHKDTKEVTTEEIL